jgi:outer membrane receptor protein involved in Fe transport
MRSRTVLAFVGLALASGQVAFAQDSSSNQAAVTDTPSEVALPTVSIESQTQTQTPMQIFEQKIDSFNQTRDNVILPKLGATSYSIDRQAILALPQGENTPIDKVLLQTPGVSYDSAVSNPNFHIRGEYANVQFRINGIQLPEGVSSLGALLETSFISNLTLLTGALPAQYGLRTAGVVDITTRSEFTPGGNVSVYGGSLSTLSTSLSYGGAVENTQYFVTARYTQSNEGLENALPTVDAIHDHTNQGKFFGYVSTLLGDSNRLTYMTGTAVSAFQIPNVTGQAPLGDIGGPNVNSATLNEKEYDTFFFNILALQTKTEKFDSQFAIYSRYANVHFVPDIPGDLAFNDVASDVTRRSLLNGIQFDSAYRLNSEHTVRGGFAITAEQTWVNNTSTVLPLDAAGNPIPIPETIVDATSKLGWNLGGYVQDEWKINSKLTLNGGLRFDQLYQFVSANQFSPRLSLTYKPLEDTTLHIGYARYFTPPMQAQATPSNIGLFNNTTQQAVVPGNSPALPERSHYFDVGIDQKVFTGLTLGADAFYKIATDLLDDGQFGQAVVLTQFNYATGYTRGFELKAKYQNEGFTTYANFGLSRTLAKDVVSNQYLFDDPVEFAFIQNNYHVTDDSQLISASFGASYYWDKTLVSVNGIFGSGLPTGFANTMTVQPYTQINLGISHEFDMWQNQKPLTIRLDVVNVLDTLYILRTGDGIGEFAPQYGPRRGVFIGLSQKL